LEIKWEQKERFLAGHHYEDRGEKGRYWPVKIKKIGAER
jgi:hypothetical protein